MAGWIKLWEIPEDHWLREDLRYIGAWNDLIQMAEPKDRKIVRYGTMIHAERGNVYTSLHVLADKWHVTRRFVKHFLEMLEQDGMISVLLADHRGYHLKVNNYAKYQDNPNHKRTTDSTTKDTTDGTTNSTTEDTTEASFFLTNNTEGIEGKKVRGRGTFVPPTITDIVTYANQNGLQIDADRFWNYYESNGWMVGKNKMRSWQATLRNWSAKESGTAAKPKAKKFDNFEPRPDGDLMDEYIKQLEGRYG